MCLAILAICIQGKCHFAVDLKLALKLTQTLKTFTDLHHPLEGLSLEPPATKRNQQ
jgi:hypothetical protein